MADVKQITLEDGKPTNVLVSLTDREAVFLVRVLGNLNGNEQKKIQSDGEVGSDVFFALDSMFNSFYDDGVGDVPR